MNGIEEKVDSDLISIDPDLDRLYREHAIAVAITSQIMPLSTEVEAQKESDNKTERLDNSCSTF